MMRRFISGVLLLSALIPAWAAPPRPFGSDSLAAIQAKYAGRPFILSLWSVNWCGHCITELTLLGQVAKTQEDLPLVLVATDATEFSAAIEQMQNRLGLSRMDSWVFDDAIPERLRIAIDPSWRGELPRTYLYNARHQREVVTGVLNAEKLLSWLKRQH